MAPRVTLDYATWCLRVHLGLLGLDESNINDGEAGQPYEDEDKMDVDNPIHDGPP